MMLLRQRSHNGVKDRIALTAVGFEERGRSIKHSGINRLDQQLPCGDSGDDPGHQCRLIELTLEGGCGFRDGGRWVEERCLEFLELFGDGERADGMQIIRIREAISASALTIMIGSAEDCILRGRWRFLPQIVIVPGR
jgi:hypothetical protein